MPNKIEYTVERGLTDAVNEVINEPVYKSLKPLADQAVKVAACFRIHTDKNDEPIIGKGAPAKVTKMGEHFRVLMKNPPHYVLVMDHGWWEEHQPDEQRDCIHAALSYIEVSADKDGNLVLKPHKLEVKCHLSHLQECGLPKDVPNLADVVAQAAKTRARSSLVPRNLVSSTEASGAAPNSDPESAPEVSVKPAAKDSADNENKTPVRRRDIPRARPKLTNPTPDDRE